MTINKLMITLALGFVLTACAKEVSGQKETLVCTLRGVQQYTMTSQYFYTTNEGRVWHSHDGYLYRPSALESCYTRPATPQEKAR